MSEILKNHLQINLSVECITEESGRQIIALVGKSDILHLATVRAATLYGLNGKEEQICLVTYGTKTRHFSDTESAVDYITGEEMERIRGMLFNLSYVY